MPPACDAHGEMAAVGDLAEAAPLDDVERPARDGGDAVIALLAVDRDVLVAERCERARRETARPGISFPAGRARPARCSASRRSTIGMRRRTELMFQVATEKGMSRSGRRDRWPEPASSGRQRQVPRLTRHGVRRLPAARTAAARQALPVLVDLTLGLLSFVVALVVDLEQAGSIFTPCLTLKIITVVSLPCASVIVHWRRS